MISWNYALGEFRRRPGRSLLTLLSVVISVAAMVAVISATSTTRSAYQRVFQALAGRADLQIVARGEGAFPQDSVSRVGAVPGVRSVASVFRRATILYAHGKRAKVLAAGVVPGESESLFGFKLEAGHFPAAAGEIALESGLASALHIGLGEDIRLGTSLGLRAQKVCGLFSLDNAVRLHQGGMLLASLEPLERVFRARGKIDALHVFLDDAKQTGPAIAAIAPLLPKELEVRVPAARSGMAEESLLLIEVSLNMVSSLSFTTAVFIVLSVFLMNVSERRRQLSILRAVGATRGQIVRLVGREALLMGATGTVLGLPLGVYGGRFLTRIMSDVLQVSLPQNLDLRGALTIGGLLGPAICLLAAWYPAHRASLVSPLEGMRPVVSRETPVRFGRSIVGALIGLGLSLLMTIYERQLPMAFAVLSVILALVSLVMLLPLALKPAVRLMAWPLDRLLGYEGEMAARLVLRRSGRSALTIGVLFIAVAAGAGTGNAVFSVEDDIRAWYERTITADFLLRAMAPDLSGQIAASVPIEVRDEVAAIDGVEKVDALRFLRVDAGGREAMLMARDFGLYARVPLDITIGEPQAVLAGLRRGQVVVGSVLAERAGLHVGDSLPIIVGTESRTLPVAGITNEYTFGGMVVYVDRAVARELFAIEGADSFLIKAKSRRSADIEPALKALAEKHGLLLQSFGEVVKMIDGTVAGVTGGLWVLLVLGLVIGSLGVINTLTMNVLEQTRELGMLRAIGMRRSQIVKTVFGQAIIIGMLGVISGGVAGLSLAQLINLSMGSLFGHAVPFASRPLFVVLMLAAAQGVVLIAALLPARRAAEINPVQAMRQE
jgi:putative ABC transport system permease protein